jgi:choline-glycine betaine transporter
MATTIPQKFNIVRYIVVAILKIATNRNCSISGLNSGHHYLSTYQIVMISDNVEFLRYCGGHFENGD